METPLRAGVLAAPFIALALLFVAGWAGYGAVVATMAGMALHSVFDAVGWLFIWVGLGVIVVTVIVSMVIGDVRIGGRSGRPVHSAFGAVAVGLAASTSLGLMFWASAGPLHHVNAPPASLDLVARSLDAQSFALYATMIHWGLIPHLLNALCLIVFGLSTQNLKRAPSVGGAILRQRSEDPFALALNAVLVFFATLVVIGAFTSSILALSREMSRFGSDTPNASALFAVALAMIFVIFVAGARPVRAVYGTLARATLILMLMMIVAVIILGPTGKIIGWGLRSIWHMILALPSMLSFTGMTTGDPWPTVWTASHWAMAMLAAPFIGLFLSRAAKGFLVAEAVFYFCVVPALVTMLWILAFGGLSLALDEATSGSLWQTITRGGDDKAVYTALWGVPGGESLIVGFMIILALTFATFAAAMLHSVMRLCAPGPESDVVTGEARASVANIWCIGVALGGWGLAATSAGPIADDLGRLGAVPALVVILCFIVAALRLTIRPAVLEPPPKSDPMQVDLDLGTMIADTIEDADLDLRPRKRRKKP